MFAFQSVLQHVEVGLLRYRNVTKSRNKPNHAVVSKLESFCHLIFRIHNHVFTV